MGISKARSDHVRLEREGAWRIGAGIAVFFNLVVGFILFYILFLLRLNSRL